WIFRTQRSPRDVAPEATISIDASSPSSYKIPRTIFGTFLEPIGNSIYGGLWAELLENPSFEDNLWSARTIQKMIGDELPLARTAIVLSGNDWKRYEFFLDVEAGKIAVREPADFVIAVANETRVLVDEASLMPADNVAGLDPEIIAMAKAMKSPLLRFGGNFTSAYHWKDGIGPRDKRVSMLNISWGTPEYNTVGD